MNVDKVYTKIREKARLTAESRLAESVQILQTITQRTIIADVEDRAFDIITINLRRLYDKYYEEAVSDIINPVKAEGE